MKFRVLVRSAKGSEWWEDYDREVGESHNVQRHGDQPVFDGDIDAWGKAIIAWFNRDEPESRHRTFVRAEKVL